MTSAIVWFRRDLRLADNPALGEALARYAQVIPVYVHAPDEESPWAPGAAGRWWLHHALDALDGELRERGAKLLLERGPTRDALARLVDATGASAIYWNRLYDPATIERDKAIKSWAADSGIDAASYNAALLYEPWQIATGQQQPYRVFTPFWKACLREDTAQDPWPAPAAIPCPGNLPAGEPLDALALLPTVRWDVGLREQWHPGAPAAADRLNEFLDSAVDRYPEQRNAPGSDGTSRLSPHLHFGEIGPRQIIAACRQRQHSDGVAGFLRQVYWREFAHHLLYHFPDTPESPLDRRFSDFPWRQDEEAVLSAWQRGRTGIPFVDAGMRELWHTGWMHNRVRMVVASLLTKNLLIPWQTGARWFWDTLVDADLANNTLGWQWTAGCGADAAPYFRIFNPVTQGQRFDADGAYVRHWVPELAALPDKWLHQPWAAQPQTLREAGITLGVDYPAPVVDIKGSRARALEIWDDLKRRA